MPVFLNVDLDVESTNPLDALVAAWDGQITVLYHGAGRLAGPSPRSRRRLLSVEASRQYKTPDAAIHALCALVEGLPPAVRCFWDQANKHFDVGYQMQASEQWTHFALKADTLARLTKLGASIAFSVYRGDLPSSGVIQNLPERQSERQKPRIA